MQVSRRHGAVRLRFESVEATLLSSLLADFVALLDVGEPESADPVVRRLFPDGYRDDGAAAAEFRELTESGLRQDRSGRTRACRDELAATDGDLALDPESGERWIQVLNDLRLAIGTRLGITEDDDHDIDPQARDAGPRTIYLWLTATQESLVQSLMK